MKLLKLTSHKDTFFYLALNNISIYQIGLADFQDGTTFTRIDYCINSCTENSTCKESPEEVIEMIENLLEPVEMHSGKEPKSQTIECKKCGLIITQSYIYHPSLTPAAYCSIKCFKAKDKS